MHRRSPKLDGRQPWPMQASGQYPDVDFDFAHGNYIQAGVYDTAANLLTATRSTTGATDLLPTSPSGYPYTTFGANTARITDGGLLMEEARTNRLLNSTAPATQTTASLGTGTYTLWVNGSGTATSSAGTATATGYGAATQGNPNTIVVTGAGTVVVTVSGSLNAFQLEQGVFGTSLIVTAGATVTRNIDLVALTTFPTIGDGFSVLSSGVPLATDTFTSVQVMWSVDDGTTNNRIQYARNATNGVSTFVGVTAGVSFFNGAGGSLAMFQGYPYTLTFAGMNSDQMILMSGAGSAPGPNSTGTFPTVTAIRLGTRADGLLSWNGLISRFVVWASTRISNSEVIRIGT